ncbi:hypothetical protein ERY430_70027 [Erythrobacter sp. EC-HK427]|nr:hypothetical protein ERY430_70027 [Erythrobacter sp. EC-HK427]
MGWGTDNRTPPDELHSSGRGGLGVTVIALTEAQGHREVCARRGAEAQRGLCGKLTT